MFPVNRRRVVLASWLATIVLVLCSGCSSHRSGGLSASVLPGEIPLGVWSGEGVFVYEDWKAEAGEEASIRREYPTSLTIESMELDGRKVIGMGVFSARGPLPKLEGENTYIRAALAEAKRVSDTTVLYRLVAFQFNPESDEKLSFDDDAPPVAASCTTRDGVTVLQITYKDNFVDTFRFEGDRLEKSGVYFSLNEGLIHWVEHLAADTTAALVRFSPPAAPPPPVP
jgi:hypothetical protein